MKNPYSTVPIKRVLKEVSRNVIPMEIPAATSSPNTINIILNFTRSANKPKTILPKLPAIPRKYKMKNTKKQLYVFVQYIIKVFLNNRLSSNYVLCTIVSQLS
jgi:hypothetical protein